MNKLTTEQLTTLDEFAAALRPEHRLFLVTGAGMSAESGLPTYRGVSGLYNSGVTDDGLTIEEILSGPTLRRNPALTWKYLGLVEQAARDASFNLGHQVIAEMESYFASVCVLTQNIDGFHVSAGSTEVIEIHGNLHRLRCTHCDHRKSISSFEEISIPPICEPCGHMLRPDVVLFEEMLPQPELQRLAEQWQRGFDAVLSVGTTSGFQYIAEPVRHAYETGLPSIEINPANTHVSGLCDYRIRAGASRTLSALWERISNSE